VTSNHWGEKCMMKNGHIAKKRETKRIKVKEKKQQRACSNLYTAQKQTD